MIPVSYDEYLNMTERTLRESLENVSNSQCIRGDHKYPVIMLKAVVSQNLWILHVFYRVISSNIDINILNQSPLFINVSNGTTCKCPFHINSVQYKHMYYLSNGYTPIMLLL